MKDFTSTAGPQRMSFLSIYIDLCLIILMFVHLVPYYNFGMLKLHGLKLFDIPALYVSEGK